MPPAFSEDQIFENHDFSETSPPEGEYRNCQFVHCDMSALDFSR